MTTRRRPTPATRHMKVHYSTRLLDYMMSFIEEMEVDGAKVPGDLKQLALAMSGAAQDAFHKHLSGPHEFVLRPSGNSRTPEKCTQCGKPEKHTIHSSAYANKLARLTQHT